MSCQFHWNKNEYKSNESEGEEVTVSVQTAPETLSGIENNS